MAASSANATLALSYAPSKRAHDWGNIPTTSSTVGGAPCTDAALLTSCPRGQTC
ncbi:MAG TPA: hypothetical protein VFZ09_50460 [Archangium sp.]|uniref:hypothetical protein n=1 Tax=Archangium sp. TaxID=1872627 RepID=UPI002E2F0278|nr:hypothetical protein [Archangium sp.]HEX5754509.1 hypothetical protein [Archangium sp.]